MKKGYHWRIVITETKTKDTWTQITWSRKSQSWFWIFSVCTIFITSFWMVLSEAWIFGYRSECNFQSSKYLSGFAQGLETFSLPSFHNWPFTFPFFLHDGFQPSIPSNWFGYWTNLSYHWINHTLGHMKRSVHKWPYMPYNIWARPNGLKVRSVNLIRFVKQSDQWG